MAKLGETQLAQKNLIYFYCEQCLKGEKVTKPTQVLLCLVRVGVLRVSSAVRYLDKPQWRAVRCPPAGEVAYLSRQTMDVPCMAVPGFARHGSPWICQAWQSLDLPAMAVLPFNKRVLSEMFKLNCFLW